MPQSAAGCAARRLSWGSKGALVRDYAPGTARSPRPTSVTPAPQLRHTRAKEIRHTRACRGYLAVVRTKRRPRLPHPPLKPPSERRRTSETKWGAARRSRWSGGGGHGAPCRTQRDTRGKRGYDGSLLRGYDGSCLRGYDGSCSRGYDGSCSRGLTVLACAGMTDLTHAGMTDLTHAGMTDLTRAGMTDLARAGMTDLTRVGMTGLARAGMTDRACTGMTDPISRGRSAHERWVKR